MKVCLEGNPEVPSNGLNGGIELWLALAICPQALICHIQFMGHSDHGVGGEAIDEIKYHEQGQVKRKELGEDGPVFMEEILQGEERVESLWCRWHSSQGSETNT